MRKRILTDEMIKKIIYLKERYKENISFRKIGMILQEDFNLKKPVHHYICSRAYKNYLNEKENRRNKSNDLNPITHKDEERVFGNNHLIQSINIKMIEEDDLLLLLPKLPKIVKWIICGDLQIPYHSVPCINELIRFVGEYEPHLLIFNGDITDFYTLSKFSKSPSLKDKDTLEKELLIEAKIYSKINEISPNTKIIKKVRGSNHELRVYKTIANKLPEISDFITLERMLFTVCYDNDIPVDIYISKNIDDFMGDLSIKHEGFISKYGIFRNLERTMYSQAVNHSHRLGIITQKLKDNNKLLYSIECGCMCRDPLFYINNFRFVRGFAYGTYNTTKNYLLPNIISLEHVVNNEEESIF